ncbi:glycosyltransferase [Patescibacteria group bacterium]|nr:glycosyltransferase [Patescibacteria group bacterium]
MIKISVVVCTYNRDKLLRDALESLVKQSLDKSEFEVIIVDNGATDNTKEVSIDFNRLDWKLTVVISLFSP